MKSGHILGIALQIAFAVVGASDPETVAGREQVQQQLLERDDAVSDESISREDGQHDGRTVDGSTTVGSANLSTIDGESVAHSEAWTHEPVCTGFLGELDSPLCVYTNSSFSEGRGISIFTTPKIADEIASLLPFQDAAALSSRGINVATDTWYTKEIPGKGMGMMAKHDLQRGDLLTVYTPFLLAHTENILNTTERERYLQIGLSQLPEQSQEQYRALAKIYHLPEVVVQDVVKANSFEMHLGGQMHLAVFPESSRLNHACAPNAQYYLDPDLLIHVVHAVRPIAKDEEITISYTTPYEPFSVRQKYLKKAFHFTCSCSRCQEGAATDSGLVEIHNLQESLGNWEADSTASVKKAERLVKVYEQEGLDAFLDNAYGHAALMYNSVGSIRGAQKYARLAAEAASLKQGPDSSDVKFWLELVENPQEHSSWKKRKVDREL
ncbi:hypothetical protein B0A52_08155 [Exophiala mesophila]|uniref:SET domain-containing protein n=1 Tax=Exophiala mesophila TaxID=212818 RepID=A0A438MV85_EXOME|nr:hypothetical protein B0A52_08155 [Exophiala mesophila]